jgi:esterase/lipase
MMTEEEKNTPITFGMLGSMFKEIEEAFTPQISALSDAVDRRCDSYEKSILKLVDMCSKTIEELNILRAFVIAVYADQNLISVERAAQVYRDYATKFSNIVKEVKGD